MEAFLKNLINVTWDDLDVEAIEASKKVLLDTIGAMIAGTRESSTQNLIQQLATNSSGEYSVIGSSEKFNLYTAGLINGTATVAVELDEGNQWSKGHPAAHVVPTLLTLVQSSEKYTVKDFIVKLVTAYEACSRFGRATTLIPQAHAHGTWGVMGAAASALLFDETPVKPFYQGLAISSSFAMPTMWDSALEGALIRNIYVGQAVENGLKTLDLLKAGYYAPQGSIDHVYGNVIGKGFDESCLHISSNNWDIEMNYYKDHAFCRYVHAPLDAFKHVIVENDIKPEEIQSVDVQTYSRAASLKSSAYHNALSAKFSIPYALAAWSYTQKTDHTVFDNKYLEDEVIRSLAEKVQVDVSSELEKDYPTVMPAEVEIKLNSGKVFKERLNVANTGLGNSVDFSHLGEKFKFNTQNLPAEQQDAIIDWIADMENKTDMHELIDILAIKESDF